jgi:hypothetical protein
VTILSTTVARYAPCSVALAALLSAVPFQGQQSALAGAAQGARVSMAEVWTSLPDFVCKEKIVSNTLEKGKTKEQRVVESIFLAQRKTQSKADGSSLYSIVESREVTAIDGKPAAKNTKIPSAPLLFDGLAANILFISDVPRYQGGQAPNLEGRLTIRIGFTTRNSQEFLQLEFPAAVSGVQIDAQTSQTLHVDSRLGSMHGGSGIPVSADFQSIEIDGKAYWLPRLVKAEAAIGKNQTATYVAEYSACRKFEVSVQVRPVR